MKNIEKLWEDLRYPENWNNEEVIAKINELVEAINCLTKHVTKDK